MMLHSPGAPYELDTEQELPEDATLFDEAPEATIVERLRAFFGTKRWQTPLLLFVMTFFVYGLLSFERIGKPSADTHFVYLANTYNSMISAKLGGAEAQKRREGKVAFELDRKPPHRNDWASYYELTMTDGQVVQGTWAEKPGRGKFELLDGRLMVLEPKYIDHRKTQQRYFVSFPPMPAVLMMPFAAVRGYAVNDVLWTLFFASLNVALLYILLARLSRGGRSGRSRKENLWLVAFFALSTPHIWCSIMGQVWFTALVMGITFTLLYVLCSIDAKHPLLAGIFCAMAFSTRTPLLFASAFFFIFVLFPGGKRLQKEQLGWAFKKLALFCLPCLAVGISLLVMNKIRFGSLTEFGHSYLAAGQIPRIKQFGLFHYHFLSMNLSAMFTLLPHLQKTAPYVVVSRHGMSLLLTSPALIYLLWPRPRENRADRFWHRILWTTVLVCVVPGVFYQNTGYEQFGFRFALDYMVYLVMLLAVGRHPITRGFKASVVFGALVNLFGAVTFKRFQQFYTNRFFP